MIIKQLSVFVENKEGRMLEITQVLKNHGINIRTLSLADTSEYGMLRLILSDEDCDRAKSVLKEAGFPARLTDVIAVQSTDRVGFLHDLLEVLGSISIEYMYTLPTGKDPIIILKVANPAEVEELLRAKSF